MIRHCFVVLLFILVFHAQSFAQQTVNGKVYSATTDSIITGASIFNRNSKQVVYSGKDGRYSIAASENDILIFSGVGFVPDTVTVQFQMLLTSYDVSMKQDIVYLPEVRVTSSYSLDSLARRNYYAHIYAKQPGITGRNRPSDGVGISLSPFSYFSAEAKQKRILKKRLVKQEREAYIDFSFPPDWVARLTGLKDDSLRLFIYRYRPSYDFCRRTDRQGMIIYISDRLKEFRKPSRN